MAEAMVAIPAGQFAEHMLEAPLETEHRWIQACDDHKQESNASKELENAKKNRYKDIVAYDHSRVKLRRKPGHLCSDYINANHIDGYCQEREYIACQGPNKHTVDDFWRMIWEYEVTAIAMVANLVGNDKCKCEQYWPESVLQSGDLVVTHRDTITEEYFNIRTFDIKHSTDEDGSELQQHKNLQVKQFHFTAWPDHGVPSNAEPLLEFLRRLREWAGWKRAPRTPIVVHCSAGVGRTGTLIAIDSMIRQLDERRIGICRFVIGLRKQRNAMVQTAGQYRFIHEALLIEVRKVVEDAPHARAAGTARNIRVPAKLLLKRTVTFKDMPSTDESLPQSGSELSLQLSSKAKLSGSPHTGQEACQGTQGAAIEQDTTYWAAEPMGSNPLRRSKQDTSLASIEESPPPANLDSMPISPLLSSLVPCEWLTDDLAPDAAHGPLEPSEQDRSQLSVQLAASLEFAPREPQSPSDKRSEGRSQLLYCEAQTSQRSLKAGTALFAPQSQQPENVYVEHTDTPQVFSEPETAPTLPLAPQLERECVDNTGKDNTGKDSDEET